MFEGRAYAAIDISRGTQFFIGHPVVASAVQARVELTGIREDRLLVTVHNPTSAEVRTEVRSLGLSGIVADSRRTIRLAPFATATFDLSCSGALAPSGL